MVLAACRGAATAPSAASHTAPASGDASSAPSTAPSDSVTLLAGAHYVTSADGVGWILSKPSENGILALTRLSLTNGEAETRVIDTHGEYIPQTPILSADQDGHLWFTYYTSARAQILEIDEETGVTRQWDPPLPLAGASPTDEQPGAGGLVGNAWDPSSDTLLFLRNVDHRLYQFDPTNESFSTVADLPITTHTLSRVSVGTDGTIAINGGQAGATTFSPTAVVMSAAAYSPRVIAGILSICIDPAGIATMDQDGVIRIGERSVGTLGAKPNSDVTFACDGIGHVFSMARVVNDDGSKAIIVIYRFDAAGEATTFEIPLTFFNGTNPHDGSPMPAWIGPSVETLLPDGEGGVWLVNVDGISSQPEVGDSPYPTLMRIRF